MKNVVKKDEGKKKVATIPPVPPILKKYAEWLSKELYGDEHDTTHRRY